MRISIITVAFEARATLERTIESFAAQSYADKEYVVVDGGSRDGTAELLERHERLGTIHRWISEPDRSLYDAMNKGLHLASGDYVGFLNADDFFVAEGSLAAVAEAVEREGADWVIGDTVVLDRQAERVTRFYPGRSFRPWQFRFGHMPPHPSTYCRRADLVDLGGFDPRFPIAADFDLLLRMHRRRAPRIAYVPKTLVAMRSGGVSNGGLAGYADMNAQVLEACRDAGLRTHPVLIWSKYAAKLFQFVRRPDDFHPGAHPGAGHDIRDTPVVRQRHLRRDGRYGDSSGKVRGTGRDGGLTDP